MLKPTALPADNPPQGRLAAPPSPIPSRLVALALGALASLLLSGCNLELLSPKGSIGEQEKSLILVALFVMLLVVIPVIVLTLWFAWRYRETNTRAAYAPTWAHSTTIEIVVWGIPCLIVAFLGVLIWNTTHKLDPYRPLASQVEPVEIEVIALNWKWLFIYPQYGVASLNQLAIPVGTPINFRLAAESMMNAFFIPQLGSMVYTMAGMQTRLHLIKTLATSREAFDAWVRSAKASANTLDFKTYRGLERPSSRDAVTLFSAVAPKLFDRVIDKYMLANGQVCRADGPESLQAFQPIPSASIGRVEQ
ncbi:ubiquinol oxidase subunit II [Ralstonia pseudosolanacearum]|uniref:ubiquinol oxidase subunit II n=1 Tax=Ralstonia pseudosolanacearum TaxID=1310165 RepID=UPI0008F82CE0|nr:ubiquinol oxidase subunit II [Ralstonia pseudosolanacearum]MCK4165106.1 ubiquinol oxidase subunit II [Ralstonia pseudosolanacearum]OIN76474.1 ubiquinol oxidase subunit II [Ralstonia solanacearum]